MLQSNYSSINTRRKVASIITVFIALVFSANAVFAAGTVKAQGMLTSVEDDGSVVIDGKGYPVSPSATVHGVDGHGISLSSLLPSRYVNFEYEYGKNGFVIIFMQEVPQ